MPTRTEIIEAGARAIKPVQWPHWDDCDADRKDQLRKRAEAALTTMLPLIKEALAAEVRELHQPVSKLLGRGWGERIGEVARFCNRCHQSLYPCATIRLVEGFEL